MSRQWARRRQLLAHLQQKPPYRLNAVEPDGGPSPGLAQQFGTVASVITYRIERMERRGLAIRHRNRGDRRLVPANITAAGESMCDAAGPVHVASVRRHFMEHVPRSALPVMAKTFSGLYSAQHET